MKNDNDIFTSLIARRLKIQFKYKYRTNQFKNYMRDLYNE